MPLSFIWPVMLVLLLLIPVAVLLYIRAQRRRQQLATSYGSFGFVQHTPGISRHIAPALFLLALAILIVALARPQTVISLPRIEGTVILAFDVSGSMAADDLKPSRMDAAKAAAKDFVQKQPPTVQIGVVAFSDNGFAIQAPTNEPEAVLAALDRLAPQRGTSLAQGILASLNAIQTAQHPPEPRLYSNLQPTPTLTPTPMPQGTYTSAVIVLLSDGENNENPNPLTAAQTALDRGVRIYTVGIGSAAGANLHINGFTVHTQLDEAALQQVAQMTSGTYYNAQSTQDLISIYDNLDPQLIIKPEQTEITSVLAGMSIVVLMIGGMISLLWFGRLP